MTWITTVLHEFMDSLREGPEATNPRPWVHFFSDVVSLILLVANTLLGIALLAWPVRAKEHRLPSEHESQSEIDSAQKENVHCQTH